MEPNNISDTSDALAPFRAQVRAEEIAKPKMSEKAAARLREINEHDRAEKVANGSISRR